MPSVVPSDIQDALSRAFQRAPTTLSFQPTAQQLQHTREFGLQIHAYANLDAYLHVGQSFPANGGDFEVRYSRSQLSGLIALDGQIYNDLMKCFVDVHQHCQSFHDNGFGQFLPISYSIIDFCGFFAQRIEGEGCLKDKLNVLSDDNIPLTDQRCQIALDVALHIIGQLADEARGVKVKCQALLNELTLFLEVTTADKSQIDELYEKVIGPRHDGSPSYSDRIEGELADIRRQAAAGIEEERRKVAEYNEEVERRDRNPFSSFFEAFGSLTGFDFDGVERARQHMRDYQAELNRLGAQQSTLTISFESVTRLCGSMRNVEDSVASALEAIRSFTTTFGRLHEDFKAIGERLASVGEVLDEDDAFIRAFAKTDLDDACGSWFDIKTLALEFVNFKHEQIHH